MFSNSRVSQPAAALQPGCEEMEKEWGNEEEMEREWGNEEEMERAWGNRERLILYISSFSLHFLPLSPFPHSLSISHIKICYILSQNVKYGIFVANVTKILTYALWGNNSGSNLLRGSLASCAGLLHTNPLVPGTNKEARGRKWNTQFCIITMTITSNKHFSIIK